VHGARVRALVVTCGARDCGSTRRSRSQRPTSNRGAGRFSCAAGYAEFGITRVMPGRWLCRVAGSEVRVVAARRLVGVVTGSA
jgi:hypothetical protein